jgi:hypothetical protein
VVYDRRLGWLTDCRLLLLLLSPLLLMLPATDCYWLLLTPRMSWLLG